MVTYTLHLELVKYEKGLKWSASFLNKFRDVMYDKDMLEGTPLIYMADIRSLDWIFILLVCGETILAGILLLMPSIDPSED